MSFHKTNSKIAMVKRAINRNNGNYPCQYWEKGESDVGFSPIQTLENLQFNIDHIPFTIFFLT